MKKKYISPIIETTEVENDNTILAGSIDHNTQISWGTDPSNPSNPDPDGGGGGIGEGEGDDVITLAKGSGTLSWVDEDW